MSISFSCVACGKKLRAPDAAAGKKAKCSGCGNKIRVPEIPVATQILEPVARKRRTNQTEWLFGVIGGFGSAFTGAVLALVSSQFFPVFGGPLERNMAEPLSPARLSLIPVHLFAIVPVATLFGTAIAVVLIMLTRSER